MPSVSFLVIGLLVSVLTIGGNGLVIYLVGVRRNIRVTNNHFVFSLAVADFACGAVHLLHRFSCYFRQWSTSCSLIPIAQFYFMYVSVANLCTLTLDRYLAIIKPLRYITFMTSRCIMCLVAVAWGLPLILFLAPYIALRLASPPGQAPSVFWKCFLAVFSFLQGCVCLALLYATTSIFIVARRHARQNAVIIKQLSFNHRVRQTGAFKSQDAASCKVLGSVVAIFIICYVLSIYDNACFLGLCEAPGAFYSLYITTTLKVVNSAANPIAYAFFKKDIKKELKRLLCHFRRRQ